ncbi:MAG: hypothetical protein CBE14_000810 [Rickettsiales bacterium TMED254]|nr:hypothetical protein [Rickettsiales bacterium]RPF77608.1 MAG: hypothetical protein CBE14_000810 [Rickettsiales bacterium TMED254]
MLDKSKIKALTFDTGGTVLDWHSGFKTGFEILKKTNNSINNPSELANELRRRSLKVVTTQNNSSLINFDEAHKIAVEGMISDSKLTLNNEEIKFISFETPSLFNSWSDFIIPFNLLKASFLCVSFTLLSNRLVYLNSKRNKINWDLILSCETLEIYKPDIEAYKKTARLLQLEPSQCLMVACHSFDLNAAKSAGFKTVFVKRELEWGANTEINVDGDYDMIVSNFNELESLI